MTDATQEYPKALYHYTTQSGLIGIVRDRAVWASNICYMNDAREFNYARELLHDAVRSLESAKNEQFGDLLPFLRPPTWDVYPNVFVFSMSEHDDSLGLWRAYSGGAAGYSVGFTTKELKTAAEKTGFQLVKCTYDKSEQQRLIRTLLDKTRSYVNDFPPAAVQMFVGSLLENFGAEFAVIAARIKHPSFAEEHEWRLVSERMLLPIALDGKELNQSKVQVLTPRKVHIRAGISTLTPYVEVPLANEEGKLALYHILVGPGIDQQRAAHAVLVLLDIHGQHSPKLVHPSTVPYRTW